MKNTILLLFLLTAISVSSQKLPQYKKVYDYGEYQNDWAKVKTNAGTYGFIDRNGKLVVPVIYSKIYQFEIKGNKRYAMVKNIAKAYGFIDENGSEVVQAIYWKKEEAYQKLNMFVKKQVL